jgi:hypothetical protein
MLSCGWFLHVRGEAKCGRPTVGDALAIRFFGIFAISTSQPQNGDRGVVPLLSFQWRHYLFHSYSFLFHCSCSLNPRGSFLPCHCPVYLSSVHINYQAVTDLHNQRKLSSSFFFFFFFGFISIFFFLLLIATTRRLYDPIDSSFSSLLCQKIIRTYTTSSLVTGCEPHPTCPPPKNLIR